MLKRINILDEQYGGAIPFSEVTKERKKKSKTKKRSKKRNKKRSISPSRARRKATKKTKRSKKKTMKEKSLKNCGCGNHKYSGKEISPTGIGKCHQCIPLGVVMKGKDNKLYENTKKGWVKFSKK